MWTEAEFAKKIKEKYPEYSQVPDAVLAQKVIMKYPVYKDQVQTTWVGRMAGAVNGAGDSVDANLNTVAQTLQDTPKNPFNPLVKDQTPEEAIQKTKETPIIGPAVGSFLEGAHKVGQGIGKVVDGLSGRPAEQGENKFNPFTNEYTPEQQQDRLYDIAGGAADVIGGGMEAAFAPITGTIGQLPGIKQAMEGLGGKADELSTFLADKIGVDDKSKEVLRSSFNNLFSLLTVKYGPKATQAVKPYVGKGLEAIAERLPVSEALKESAKTQIGKVFSPTTNANKNITQRISEKVASGGEKLPTALTQKGLQEQLAATAEGFGEKVGASKAKITGSTAVSELKGWIKEQRQKYVQEGKVKIDKKGKAILDKSGKPIKEQIVLDEAAVKHLDDFQKALEALPTEKGFVQNEILQSMKEKYDNIIRQKPGGFGKTDAENTAAGMMKDWRDVLRDWIAAENPELNALNQKYHFFKSASDVLQDTIKRQTGQHPISSKLHSIFGAGLATGVSSLLEKGLIVGGTVAAIALMRSTGWKLVSIKWKLKLADALAKGDSAAMKSVMEKIVETTPEVLSGQIQQQFEE